SYAFHFNVLAVFCAPTLQVVSASVCLDRSRYPPTPCVVLGDEANRSQFYLAIRVGVAEPLAMCRRFRWDRLLDDRWLRLQSGSPFQSIDELPMRDGREAAPEVALILEKRREPWFAIYTHE